MIYNFNINSSRKGGEATKEAWEEDQADERDDWRNPSRDWLRCDFAQFLVFMTEWYGESGVPNIVVAIQEGRLPKIKEV